MTDRKLPPLESIELSEGELRKQNRRSFFKWALLMSAGVAGLSRIFSAEEDRGVPWPLRRANEIGESFWKSQFHNRLAPERPQLVTGKPRLNGDVGLTAEVDASTWKLGLSSPSLERNVSLSLFDLQKLPQVTETIEFKCVEGWSEWMTFSGVRFSEFMMAQGLTDAVPQYAKLTSIDDEYYVAMDLKSLMHPQTLLCLSMNGAPLSREHGYPVRLVSSVKYGVKNIKQLGTIEFTETIPADYWAENGYGEYLGL